MEEMELVKWPFLNQTWGIEFERSEGSYLYTKDGKKITYAGFSFLKKKIKNKKNKNIYINI